VRNVSVDDFVTVRTCTYKNLDTQYSLLHTLGICYSVLLLGFKPVQHVIVLNTLGNCNTVVTIII
jgi:hypothetical protein